MTTIVKAFHPGGYILDEIEERGRTQKQLAELIGVSQIEVNHLVKGRRNMTAKLAMRIGEAFGTSAEVWMKLQNRYDMYILSLNNDEIKAIENISIRKQDLALV